MVVYLFACTSKEKVLIIEGEVIGGETKGLLLMKLNQDLRFDSLIQIPVENGKFHYKMKFEYPEAVELIFQEARTRGSWNFMPLFLEEGKINLTIYGEKDFNKNIVEGGKLNALLKKYKKEFKHQFDQKSIPIKDSIKKLQDNGEYYNDAVNVLLEKMKKAKTREEKVQLSKKITELYKAGNFLSSKAKMLDEKEKALRAEQYRYMQDFVSNNTSLISYYFFINHFLKNKEKLNLIWARKTYEELKKNNPNHPYNEFALSLIDAIDNIKVGKKFIDFSAPNLEGKRFTLSNEIKGKVALLDLWATWCGSCIRQTRTMIPVYNDYKDKGFIIVGVAGEFKNTDRLTKFLQKEKWEWLQLVELNRQNKIWNKYGVDNAGGSTFLIDKNGTILAKNPTAKKVREELEKRLK